MGNRWKKWFAVVMATVLGMPGYGLSAKNITTKAEDESIVIHIENEERHVQTGETVSLLDGVSVEGSGEESYRAVVGDVQEQDSGLSLYEEGMEELVIPSDAAGKTYRVLYKAQSSIDDEEWNNVEGSEKEALLIVDGSHEEIAEENKGETSEEESKEEKQEENKEEEIPQPITVTLQGKEKEEAEVGEVFSFVHDVTINCSQEDENTYRIVVRGVDTPENGSYQYQEGDTSFIPQKDDEGLTYVVHYGVDIHKDDESHDNQWEQVEGVSFDKEVIVTDKVIIQGEEEITVLAGEEYNFMHDGGLVVKGSKEEEITYRLKVKGVKSPEGGSYTYQEGDESFTPKESDEGLVYEVTYGVETSKDQTTWEEVEDVQFTQKIITAVFKPEPVRGPLATEAILCQGLFFRNFLAGWNSGSAIKVKNLVKADVPADLMTASLRYKYETISDPSSPVKIYMWHDMNAYGQYTDTVYFGTEVPGVTIYTNPNATQMLFGIYIEKIYDSANPSTPYFFNTSKTSNMSQMFTGFQSSSTGIPFDCTNGNGVSPFGLMDTSNVTNLSGMFSNTNGLDFTGIETWNVHKVTDISSFFAGAIIKKIPWGIGNWEFDNLQNVDNAFKILNGEFNSIELNMEKWDLSHCDASKIFRYPPENVMIPACFSRLKIGSKLVDKNGKAFLPLSKYLECSYSSTVLDSNGTWENETTGQQYFQCNPTDFAVPYKPSFLNNNVSATEFNEAYASNPIGMSGTYKFGKGHWIIYDSNGNAHDDNGFKSRIIYYKKTDMTATLINNPCIWRYHYFQKWEEQYSTPHQLNDPGDTIALNRNYFFKATWSVITRTITYDLDGGVNPSSNPTTFIADEGQTIDEPTKAGMVFAGWTWTSASKSMLDPWYLYDTNGLDESAKNDPARAFPDEDVVLKAHWALPRTLIIHGNGGTTGASVTDLSVVVPDVTGIEIGGKNNIAYNNKVNIAVILRGKYLSNEYFKYENHISTGIKDRSGAVVVSIPAHSKDDFVKASVSSGTNDFYVQWKFLPKKIKIEFNPVISSPYIEDIKVGYTAPDGSHKAVDEMIGNLEFVPFFKEYTGKQWDEDSPNVTISIKGHETGAPNEYVFDDFEEVNPYTTDSLHGYIFQSFTISSPGSSHTYPTGNQTSYTFTGGFDKDVTITLNWVRAWRIQYVNLDDTPITTMQTLKEADLPYTFHNTYPPHALWHGFPVLPVGWTIEKYNKGNPDTEGIYTNTGNLPTLFKGTWDATQFDTVDSTLKLYPMYSVDVNKDGIPDLFQNKATFIVTKEIVKGQYSNLPLLMGKVFPYEVTFNDVHGDPIKNWLIQDTNGQTYTTDNSGKVTINLRHQESVSFKGMLPNMILRAVETDTKGMSAEYAISYNGTSFTSGTDTGSITYQDNTPLTVSFKNTAGGNIVPAGIKDTNTRVYVLLAAVLLALLFSIRLLKRSRRA